MAIMDMVKHPVKTTGRGLDKLAKAGAFTLGVAIGLQGPGFYQAYLQRLGGHADEAFIQAKYCWDRKDSIPELCYSSANRANELRQDYISLKDAKGILAKPIALGKAFDLDIAQGTLGIYKATAPLTKEGLIYGLGGGVAGIGVTVGLGDGVGVEPCISTVRKLVLPEAPLLLLPLYLQALI
ncbi:DUF2937 family protein [Candidatus Pacearchaeota archaeon]|nr:DUF2937 family protein [Candidatus Pacearchaeota archaeon]